MAIVKMKRLHLIALAQDRDALLASLQHVGCVELREPGEYLADESYAALLHRETSDLAQARGDLAELQHAIEALRQYAPQKGSLFAPRAQLGEAELLDSRARQAALDKAAAINGHARTVGQTEDRKSVV